MRRGKNTSALSTKDASAFGASFVPWRKEPQGHNPGNKRAANLSPSAVTEPVSELIDHTLYIV
jgi:hypothetical protein